MPRAENNQLQITLSKFLIMIFRGAKITCKSWQLNASQYNSKKFNTSQWKSMQFNASQCKSMRVNASQCKSMHVNARQCESMQVNASQCRSMQVNTNLWNSTQLNASQCKSIHFFFQSNSLVRDHALKFNLWFAVQNLNLFSLFSDWCPNPTVSRFPRRFVWIARPTLVLSRSLSSKNGATDPPNLQRPQRSSRRHPMTSLPSPSSKNL